VYKNILKLIKRSYYNLYVFKKLDEIFLFFNTPLEIFKKNKV